MNYNLRALAENSSFEMTEKPLPERGTFYFERLPRELRHQILSFTGLGCHKDNNILRIVDCKLVSRRVHVIANTCCWKCTDIFADCCCSKLYAAYSASCVCRMLPLGLFSVSKQMYEDAFQVFYTYNTFELASDPNNALVFLKSLPKDALSLIRRLRFLFGEDDLAEWRDRKYSEKWQSLVGFIKDNFNVPNLSIEIDTLNGSWGFLIDTEGDLAQTRSRYLYDIYCDLGRALHMIPDLSDLYFLNGWFFDLGPLLAKDIIGEEKYKPRPVPKHDHKHDEAWDVPVWWYQWPTTSPNPSASVEPFPIVSRPRVSHGPLARGGGGGGRGGRGRGRGRARGG